MTLIAVGMKIQIRRSLAGRICRPLALLAFALAGHVAPAQRAEAITSAPFSKPSAARGKTLFSEIPPTASGVITKNDYADPKMWNEYYHELEIGAIGCGVGIGDFDKDGKPDIFIANKVESCRLFRNLGDWKFEDVTAKSGVRDTGEPDAGPWKQGVAVADVNNDGWLDIYVCRFNAANLLYINQRNGTFKEAAAAHGLAVKDASNMASFCDYDRDGWLDVYVQTNLLSASQHPKGQRDYLFHNNGDGTFADVSVKAGVREPETQGHSAIWWDYNNDGWPDLYVANDFESPDLLYRNNKDGTFSNTIDEVVPHMPFSSMGSDLGDVNNDGLIDLLVGDMATTTHQKDHRTMVDARANSKDPPEDSTAVPSYQRNALYLNTNTGRMLEGAFLTGLAATDWTWSIRFEDLDNDGRVDLHVTNGMYREINNADLLWKLMTAESAQERVRLVRSTAPLAESNLALRNLGDLRFENVSQTWGLDQKGVSFGAAFGDLDGDGDLDVVYTNYQAGATLLRNDNDKGNQIVLSLRGTKSNPFGVGAVVKLTSAAGVQIRQLVLARGYMSTSEPVLHFGLGDDATVEQLEILWPSGGRQVLEKLPANRRYTITEPSNAPRAEGGIADASNFQFEEVSKPTNLSWIAREESVSEIEQQPLLPTRFNRRGPALAIGDVDGNGRNDLLIGGTSLDSARVLFGSAPGEFVESKVPTVQGANRVNDGPVLIFDANGDGKNDLLITKGGSSQPAGAPEYQPSLFINSGAGLSLAGPEILPPLPISAGSVAAADFDRDGQLDLFVGARVLPGEYPTAPNSALLHNTNGRFTDVTDSLSPGLRAVGLVTAALWSDVDGDGWQDLLVCLEWSHVRYFHNDAGQKFEDRTEQSGFASAGTGWWQSIASGDFNRDGRLDYVLGNVGLNTQYRADAQRPAVLYYGEFKEGSRPLPIEAYYEEDKLYPWRSRKDLGAAMPSILQRFRRSDYFARATLGQIIGEEKLAGATRFAATELRSGVLLSQQDGPFRFAPFPNIAQISPLQGIATGDFDGDGNTDIYAVQNSYSPHPVVGRFDGGLSQMLRGDGRGGFVAVPPDQSGLVVPGDAEAIVVMDIDDNSWPDFVVTRNGATSLAFRNKPIATRNSLHVVVHARTGKTAPVGARITVEHSDGSTQMAEISAGSGYNQSGSESFFGSENANPAKLVRVRWPSGSNSEHAVSSPSGTLELIAPEK